MIPQMHFRTKLFVFCIINSTANCKQLRRKLLIIRIETAYNMHFLNVTFRYSNGRYMTGG